MNSLPRLRGLVAALSLLLGGFSPLPSAPPAPTHVLRVGNQAEPGSLDPACLDSQQSFNVVMALMEGLAQYDPQTCLPAPAVAERWEVSADRLQWTYHLRASARWSNGDPLVAEDFVYAFRRTLSPKLGADNASMLYVLKNGQRFHEGKVHDFAAVGATAAGDHTLILRLEKPVPYFARLVCHAAWYPVHRRTIETHGAIDQRGTVWTRPGTYTGNGPFFLAEWKPNQLIRVTKSPTYWNHAKVQLEAVIFFPIESETTEEAMFRTGQLDVTSTVPAAKIATYKNNPKLRESLQQHVELGTYFYGFNVEKPPLDDVRVRRALSLSIDRAAIVRHVALGDQTPAEHLTPPNTAGFTATARLGHAPEQARELLAQAGFPGGRNFPRLELLFNSNENHRRIAEAIQEMWRRDLGIQVALVNQDGKTVRANQRLGQYQISRFGWTGDYLDPSTFLDIMASDDGNNQTRWKNAEFDRLLAAARDAGDDASRFTLFNRAEAILAAECPIAPIYFSTRSYLRQPAVQGWFGNLLNLHPLAGVSLAP